MQFGHLQLYQQIQLGQYNVPDFQFLLEDIAIVQDMRSQKAVSLNLEARKLEQEERRQARLDRENARRSEQGLEPIESMEDMDEEEVPDVLLNQAAEILTDMATLSGSRSPVLSRAK